MCWLCLSVPGRSVEGMSCSRWEAISSRGQVVGWLNWRNLKICEWRKKTAETCLDQWYMYVLFDNSWNSYSMLWIWLLMQKFCFAHFACLPLFSTPGSEHQLARKELHKQNWVSQNKETCKMCGAVGPQELRNTTLTSTLHAKSFCSLCMETDIFTLLQFNQPSCPYCLPGFGGLAKHAAADLI